MSRLPSGVLLLQDGLPYLLGGIPRFVLDKVEPQGRRTVSYPVHSDVRGRFPIGPLSVRLTDPFGLVELSRAFASVDELVVTPVVSPLPPVRLGGDWAGGGESTARSVAASGTDDTATREYRHGDDLRKVHWRSTARRGELMVRREEEPFQSRATLLLDGRASAHRGQGPGSSYEWAVSAVASAGVALSRSGFALHLLDHTGRDLGPPGVPVTEGVLLQALADAQPDRTDSLEPAIGRLRRGGVDGALIAVLGRLDAEQAAALARLRPGSANLHRRAARHRQLGAGHPPGARGRPGRPRRRQVPARDDGLAGPSRRPRHHAGLGLAAAAGRHARSEQAPSAPRDPSGPRSSGTRLRRGSGLAAPRCGPPGAARERPRPPDARGGPRRRPWPAPRSSRSTTAGGGCVRTLGVVVLVAAAGAAARRAGLAVAAVPVVQLLAVASFVCLVFLRAPSRRCFPPGRR